MIMPKYLAIAAITLDGKIAKDDNHLSTEWTSEEDKIVFRKLLKECDVVLIGKKTWETAKGPLAKRNCIVLTRSVAGIRQEHNLLTFINAEKASLKQFITDRHYNTVGILGGAQVYAYCLEHGMIDELYLTVEPIVFGTGISLFTSKDVLNAKFELISLDKLNEQGSLLLKYKRVTGTDEKID